MLLRESLAVLQVATFILCLCTHNLSAEEPGKESPGDTQEKSQKQSESQIKAGYGTSEFHIGMSRSDFGSEWKQSKEGPLINNTAGIGALIHDGRARGFWYNYGDSTLLGKCALSTDKGVTQAHKIVEVQAVYGEPSHIDLTLDQRNGDFDLVVELFYEELGMHFRYRNGELATISVKEPRKDFDYKRYSQNMKDFLVYIRQPKQP